MRIHPVVNVSQIVRYKEQVKSQKKEEGKPIEVEGGKEQEVEKILNKRKIQEIDRYLVQWKGFMAENNTWEKEEDLGNAKELVDEYKGRLSTEIRRQEGVDQKWKTKLNPRADQFKRMELLGKYTAKLLYGQDDKKFEEEYLKKLERNQNRQKNNRKESEEEYVRKLK